MKLEFSEQIFEIYSNKI